MLNAVYKECSFDQLVSFSVYFCVYIFVFIYFTCFVFFVVD